MNEPVLRLLFGLVLTVIVVVNYVRYARPPAATTASDSLIRGVILVVGGLLTASFLFNNLRDLMAVFGR